MIRSDMHLHSHYSADSKESMTAQVERGIEMGLSVMCFTDHIDWDFPIPEIVFDFDIQKYLDDISNLQEQYGNKIQILKGVELGMQTQLGERYRELLKSYPFDYAISSQHLVKGRDPFYPEVFEGREDGEVFREYFEDTLNNLQLFHDADTLAHLDYVVRYGTNGARDYCFHRFGEIIDEILRLLVRYDIALEVNTAGIRKGLGFTNPHPDVIRRYRELGGQLITVGSDAHVRDDLGKDFNLAEQLLKDLNFTEICYFIGHTPVFMKI